MTLTQPSPCHLRQGISPQRITILTPYLGQLALLRKTVAAANISVLLNDVDAAEMAEMDEEQEEEGQGGGGGGGGGAGGGGSRQGKASSSALAGGSGQAGSSATSALSGVRQVSLEQAITLATIDNYQVGGGASTVYVHCHRCHW